MFLIDLEQGRIVDDEELKNQFAERQALPAVDRERAHPARLDRRRRAAPRPSPSRCSTASRPSATRRRTSSSCWRRWPPGRRRSHRLDGQRQPAGRAVRQEQAAVQLLQAAVRAGHEPADRPDPRGDRDVAEQLHRPQAQPAGHQRRQPADAPGGDAAGARLRRHGAPARHRAAHPRQVQPYELDITYPLAWGREGVEAKLASLCARRSTRSRAATTS
jgi:glutamate synthase (NADPH/NADH) large chain